MSKQNSTPTLPTLFSFLGQDLKAGLSVALVALPLCLGISLASGAPLMSGLIAGIVGGIIIGVGSNSAISVSGPAAGLAVVVLGTIKDVGGFQIFLASVIIAGIIQVALGMFRAGFIAQILPTSVIEGMLSAIGLILITKQLPIAMGLINFPGYKTFVTDFQSLHFFQGAWPLSIVGISLYLIYLNTNVKKLSLFKVVPLSLVVILLSSVMAYFLQNSFSSSPWILDPRQYVNLGPIGEGGSLLSALTFPDWSHFFSAPVLKGGFVIAAIASVETLLCIEATDKLDTLKRTTNTNRELLAQGVGNVISGLIGGLPITSVIVRSSVNASSGAKTKLSAIFHGVLLLAGVLTIPGLLTYIPLPALAVILLFTGYNLANPKLMKKILDKGAEPAMVYFGTILAILGTDLLTGVIAGIILAMALDVRRGLHTRHYTLDLVDSDKNHYHMHFKGPVSFYFKAKLKNQLGQIPPHSTVALKVDNHQTLGHDISEIIEEFAHDAPKKNITIRHHERLQ